MNQTIHARVTALIAAGLLATTVCGTAYADTVTSGNGSLGGGNQLVVDGDVPVNLCGNAIAVLGIAGASCAGGEAKVVEKDDPAPEKTPEKEKDKDDGGYEGHVPEDEETPGVPETPEGPVGETPPVGPSETPEDDRDGQTEEEETVTEEAKTPVSETPATDAPTAPAMADGPAAPEGDDSRLAVTGADQSSLTGMVAAAALAVAAGVGLLLFGKRRRARA